jgi:integrase
VDEGQTREQTTAGQLYRVQRLLGDATDSPIAAIDDRRAQALYQKHHEGVSEFTGKPLSAATHRQDLMLARFAWAWAKREGYAASNPWETVKPVGRARKGKLQLRPSAQGQDKAVGVLCCLELGLRASEVLAITKRDLDRGVLFVEGTKTASSRRRIGLPPELRHQLELLAVARPSGPLIAGTRHNLHAYCKALCARAGVPKVGPHALRGTHASLATLGGASVESVARVLGHARSRVTTEHYVSSEAEQAARVEGVRAHLYREGNVPESFPQS